MKIILKSKYKPLVSSGSRYFIISGGRASGKSYSVASYLLMLTFEKNHKILFTRYTMSSAHISIIPEFINKIESLDILQYFDITQTSIINKITGSKILFRGMKTSSGIQTANLKSIEGITTWVLDEAEELVDEDVFDKIDLSIRTKNNQNRVIIIMNPATKEHFVYRRFFEARGVQPGSNMSNGNVTYIHTSYMDNMENINESILNQIESLKETNEKRYNHIIMGSWLDKAEGVVFNNWEVGDYVETDKVIYGSDFGFSIDPSTCISVSFDGNTIYVKEVFHRQRMVTEDFINEYRNIENNPLIIADSAEGRLIEEISKKGINIRKTLKKPGSVKEGILFMQDYNIVVDKSSINIIKELNNYSWSDKASGQPIDKWNHCIDAIRYVVQFNKQSSGNVPFYVG
jgi:phage terminase large subunit